MCKALIFAVEGHLPLLSQCKKLHAKTWKIVNNSAVDYSISLKFCSEIKGVAFEVL